MITKSIKKEIKTIEVETEVFNIELNKDQLIELCALLGQCHSGLGDNNFYNKIYNAIEQLKDSIESFKKYSELSKDLCVEIHGAPRLKFL